MGKNKAKDIIKNNFEHYQEIGSAKKRLTDSVIFIEPRQNHITRDHGEVILESCVSETLKLEVEASNLSSQDFKFKIFDRSFMPTPCYRFDSDGEAHNNLGDIPLKERQITTPHFHKFDREGNLLAYKTELLKEQENAVLLDQKLAFAIFAEEENIVYDRVPDIRRDGELLAPDNVLTDPLQGEPFYE